MSVTRNATNAYNYGTEAPDRETYIPRRERRLILQQEIITPEQLEAKRREKLAREQRAKKRRARQLWRGILVVSGVMILVGILIFSCILLLSTASEITAQRREIKNLKTEISELQTKNDSDEVYLDKSVDLDEIYRIATEELGMSYPDSDQVIYYEMPNQGYVRQYDDIPGV